MTTSDPSYSCWSLLPAPEPRTVEPPDTYFYDNVAKHLIKDTVRIMANGLHIDLDKVEQLETTLNTQLELVATNLAANPLIQQFLTIQYASQIEAYKLDRASHLKPPTHFAKPFDPGNMVHRSYFMHLWALRQGLPLPSEEAAPGISKWPVNLCKKFPDPIIRKLVDGTIDPDTPLIVEAMALFAQHKADLYNAKYVEQMTTPSVPYPIFNPGSSAQKQQLFEHLGIEPLAFSKDTGLPSWGRDQIEELQNLSTDPNLLAILQCFIDHSFAAIVRNNFIEAFYKYTIQDRLYGTYRLIGAKSGRYTSSNP